MVNEKIMIFIIIFSVNEALLYGAYMLGQSLVYAPSFNSAKACGARILSIINREPKVKTENGLKDRKDWVKLFIYLKSIFKQKTIRFFYRFCMISFF